MAEMDAFDRGLESAFLRLVDEVPSGVDGIAVAHRVAGEHPRGRVRGASLGRATVPGFAWLLLLGLLLAALGSAALLAGAQLMARPALVTTEAPPAAETLAPAVIAPAMTPAPSATPIDVPPGMLSPSEAAYLRVPVVTPSALGRISWTVWLPSDTDSSALPLNTPHGPVILQGENLFWRLASGTWKAAPILGTASWPGAALGDDLILTDTPLPARFHWTGSDWVRAGSVEGLEGFNGVLGLTARDQAIVAFGPSGIASSSDGIRFVRALDGPSCVMSVTSTGDRFEALSGRCGLGEPSNGILDSNKNAWFEPTPWTSADGRSWQPAGTISPFGRGATVTGVASHGGRQVAIGVAPPSAGQGPAASSAASLEPAAWVSDDGLAWRRLPGLPEPPCDPATCSDVGAWGGFRTIVASDAGWLILSFGSRAWTSADGLAWEPLHDSPRPWFGYFPPLAAMSSDLIVMGSESSGQGGVDDPRSYYPVAIGTILGP